MAGADSEDLRTQYTRKYAGVLNHPTHQTEAVEREANDSSRALDRRADMSEDLEESDHQCA